MRRLKLSIYKVVTPRGGGEKEEEEGMFIYIYIYNLAKFKGLEWTDTFIYLMTLNFTGVPHR